MAVRRFYRGPQRLDIRRLAAYDPGSLWIRADTNDPYPFRVQCSAIGGSLPAAGSAAYKPKQSRVFQLDQDSKNPHSDASKCGFPYLLLCSPLLRRRHSPWFLACFLIVCPGVVTITSSGVMSRAPFAIAAPLNIPSTNVLKFSTSVPSVIYSAVP